MTNLTLPLEGSSMILNNHIDKVRVSESAETENTQREKHADRSKDCSDFHHQPESTNKAY